MKGHLMLIRMNDINLPITLDNIKWFYVIQKHEEDKDEICIDMDTIKQFDAEEGRES